VAFARPTHDEKVPRERATVIVAIDVSLSMEATDVDPSRLQAVKVAAAAFVDQLPPKINVGLVSFAANSRIDVAPTTDRTKVKRAIDRLQVDEGTAIGEAIFNSLSAIQQQASADDSTSADVPARIVLMSDGKTTQGRANGLAVVAAQQAKVPVSTIAFGTDHGEIVVPQEPFPVPVPVDKEALQEIADQTGGSFFAAASEEELQQVYADIGSSIGFDLEPREVSSWFVGIALLALIGTAAMSLAWFNRLP
jgi:Ca-activated chloride channel family protein